MKKQGEFDQFFSSDFPRNRYEALEEVRAFLEFSHVDWRSLCAVLLKVSGGYVAFEFGDIIIGFSLNFEPYPESESSGEVSIELQIDEMEKTATYKYKVEEIETLVRES